ncbi:uncharacterized protein LOC116805770 [Drosophila grimshawi]|uniref:uncharacterized protein LOC116805770 n=1 Tax=Drosophila grimshawi TaxID=7222 RepID=UPI000C86EAA6|nr:uncharacterized protein LOC116805770 [Drosophila grimshawi]
MSSSKRFAFSQLALQSGKSMGTFCHHPPGGGAISAAQHSISKERQMSRLSKVIGLKKTLVNQMQGMMQTMRSSPVKLKSSTYRIYGPTRRLCSSMSSLPSSRGSARNFSSSSSCRQQAQLTSSAEQRYHHFGDLFERRNGDLARDISRSIQDDLMVIDLNTKRLISCANTKIPTDKYDDYDNRQHHHHHHNHHQHSNPRQRHGSLPSVTEWNETRMPKAMDAMDTISKQMKPLRRKLTNIRLKDNAILPNAGQQFAQPNQQSRKLQMQLGELYANSIRQRNHKTISKNLKSNTAIKQQITNHAERELDMATATAAAASGTGQRSGKSSRMDEVHYQSKKSANLMSASQRVINKQFEGYREANKSKLIVQAVSPTPLSKAIQPPPTTRTRLITMGQTVPKAKELSKSTEHVKKENNWYKSKAHNNVLEMAKSVEITKKLEKSRQAASLSTFSRRNFEQKRGRSEQKEEQSSQQLPIQMGEMRELAKPEEKRDNSNAELKMPSQYTKESAVQQLGNVAEKRPIHIYSKQRMF